MKTAMIFGVTGQDGSYLAELLLKKNYNVIGVTRRVSVDTLSRIKHLTDDERLILVEGDVTDCFCVNKLIRDYFPREIYNLAAQSHVGVSFDQPSLTWDVTASGCLNILEAIRYSGKAARIKFYQASSSEMFGKSYSVETNEYTFDHGSVTGGKATKYQNEKTPFVPQSPYAIAKLAAHHLVRNYRDSYGIFGCCGILFNHESERRGEKFVTRKITKWIGEFLNWEKKSARDVPDAPRFTINEETISIPIERMYIDQIAHPSFPKVRLGNLNAKRDWGHAEDYVKAMFAMMQQAAPDDYVIATGKTHSIRDFLDAAFNAVGMSGWKDFVVIDKLFYRPAEVDHLLGDPGKAKKELKWEPSISFEQLVERMVKHDVEKATV